jgi:hypothetical protein
VLALKAAPGGALTITAVKREGLWRPEEARRAAARLTAELGVTLRAPALPDSGLSGELCFFQAPRYTATVGFVSRAKESTHPSGDSHLAAGLSSGRVLLMLSDGMGTGAQAARESRAAVRLIRRFLAAEVEYSLAFDSVNQLLMLVGGEDMFATVDLCVLDLNACTASFSKLGGCDSLLIRRGALTRIEGGRLPMGILEGVTPAGTQLKLQPGDTLLMMTDGLFDASRDGEAAWLEQGRAQALGRSAPGAVRGADAPGASAPGRGAGRHHRDGGEDREGVGASVKECGGPALRTALRGIESLWTPQKGNASYPGENAAHARAFSQRNDFFAGSRGIIPPLRGAGRSPAVSLTPPAAPATRSGPRGVRSP